MIQDDLKWREKNWWVFYQEKVEKERQTMALEDVPQRLKLMDKTKPAERLALTNFESASGLFFMPENEQGLQSFSELPKDSKDHPMINYENTRFPEQEKPLEYRASVEANKFNYYVNNLATPDLLGVRKKKDEVYDLDKLKEGPESNHQAKQIIQGYEMLNMPSPSPSTKMKTIVRSCALGERVGAGGLLQPTRVNRNCFGVRTRK